jgi:hypothetical protein
MAILSKSVPEQTRVIQTPPDRNLYVGEIA